MELPVGQSQLQMGLELDIVGQRWWCSAIVFAIFA
jgi:hypothetical protein